MAWGHHTAPELQRQEFELGCRPVACAVEDCVSPCVLGAGRSTAEAYAVWGRRPQATFGSHTGQELEAARAARLLCPHREQMGKVPVQM